MTTEHPQRIPGIVLLYVRSGYQDPKARKDVRTLLDRSGIDGIGDHSGQEIYRGCFFDDIFCAPDQRKWVTSWSRDIEEAKQFPKNDDGSKERALITLKGYRGKSLDVTVVADGAHDATVYKEKEVILPDDIEVCKIIERTAFYDATLFPSVKSTSPCFRHVTCTWKL
jgi:hypothetical protein